MIGKLLGHSQDQITARYAHLARDSIQTTAARITGSIGRKPAGRAGRMRGPASGLKRALSVRIWLIRKLGSS